MSALPLSMPLPPSFHLWLGKLARDRKLRLYTATVLGADAVGYSLVFLLNHRGVGPTWSNIFVSGSMTPAGLALNTWTLTGKWWPSPSQFVTWFTYWLPSLARNTAYNAWLVGTFELSGTQARAGVALTFFLFDYAVKRWIIFGRYGELARFHYTKLWIKFHRELFEVEIA